MALSRTRRIDRTVVEEICGLKDAVYRNCWITYGYHNLSERLHEHIGDNASWCTFARWSSFTVGESLRLDRESRRLNDVLSPWFLRPFRRIAQGLYKDVRNVSDGAMPRTLALGNHYVFHEIGYAVADFLAWYERTKAELCSDTEETWMVAWTPYRATIEPFRGADELFRPGDVKWLKDGLECYFRAMRPGLAAVTQGQLVLRGNILLAAYEQWRLDPILQIALDPFAKHLVEFHAADPHPAVPTAPGVYPRAVLRRQGTRWALRHRSALHQWLADKYASILTRHWMTLELPIHEARYEAVVVGRGVRVDDAHASLSRQRRLDDDELMKLVSIYDHNRDRGPRGAKNWNSFANRMQFIVELFLELQTNKRLYEPMDSEELALLDLDLDEANLDDLRTVGDDAMDVYVREHCTSSSLEPRGLVRDLIRRGLTPELDAELPESLRGNLPPWANEKKLERGQAFLLECGVQIATALFSAALPLSYTAAHGARVLTTTAELASGNVNRRVAETGKMLLDLMTSVAGAAPMQPGTPGSNAARGVRLFHAAIRRMLLAGKWDVERHGYPINQEDLLGTLVAFTVVVVDALETIGVSVDRETQDSYVHLWMVVGYLLGIDFALVRRPQADGTRSAAELTLPELRLLGDALWRRNAQASPDGQSLTAALMQLFRESAPRGLRGLPAAATRQLIGDESGDLLEVPAAGAPGRLVLRIGRPITRLVSRGQLTGLPAGRLQRRTIRVYEQWIRTNRGDRPPWSIDGTELKKKMRLGKVVPPARGRRATDANR